MGNCQATDAAAIVIQRRGGKAEKIFWPISAGEVMKNNPGFYVALISVSSGKDQSQGSRYTRVRVLRPKDNLLLGQVYRLVTTKEVMKGLRARKRETMALKEDTVKGEVEKSKYRGTGSLRQWRPSLQSIEEVGG